MWPQNTILSVQIVPPLDVWLWHIDFFFFFEMEALEKNSKYREKLPWDDPICLKLMQNSNSIVIPLSLEVSLTSQD